MREAGFVVVKVGGSLLEWPGMPARLSAWLRELSADRVALVVGGGAFADAVRRLDRVHGLGEERSHGLALRSMDLSARVLAELVPGLVVAETFGGIEAAWKLGAVAIFAPRAYLEGEDRAGPDPLARSWESSSDSIAARVARRLGAGELVLLKSADPAPGLDREAAARAGLVDRRFPDESRGLRTVNVVNLRGSEPRRVELP